MNISIVIPNYNGREILEKNLPSVLNAARNYKKGSVEIIVTDDCSHDDSIAFLTTFINTHSTRDLPIYMIANQENGGFSVNVNRGVKKAKGDIVVLLNSDVSPYENFLMPLVKHFEEEERVFAVGCMDESIENKKAVMRGRGIGKWEKGFLIHSAGKLDKSTTLWVSGGSGAFRKSLWKKLHGLNILMTPFYWEDIDLSYRAQKMGYRVIFEKKSIVIHEHSKGAIKTFFKPFSILKIVYRNQFFFVWCNITDRNLLISHIFWLPYHMITALIRRDRAFVVGFFLAVAKVRAVLAYRRRVVKHFVRTDYSILEQFRI